MNIQEKIKNNKYLVLALLFAFLNMAAIFWFWGFRHHEDSIGPINHINRLQGSDVWVSPWNILTPLAPVFALPFEFLGEGAGLIVQNILFYFFSAYLIFRIIEMVLRNKEQAFWGVMLFTVSLPILLFGLSYMTDMGAWFFYILSLFLTLLYLRYKDEKLILINGFLSAAGVLIKPNGGLGILFFVMMILLAGEFNFRQKFLKIVKFGVFFAIPIIIFQIVMFISYDFTYLQGYFNAKVAGSAQGYKLQSGSVYENMGPFAIFVYAYSGDFLKAFGLAGLFFAVIGLWREWLQKFKEGLGRIYLALLPSLFIFLIWPPTDSRFAFLSAPLLILLAIRGLVYLKGIFSGKSGKILVYVLMAGHVVFNYYFFTAESYRKIFMKLIDLIK